MWATCEHFNLRRKGTCLPHLFWLARVGAAVKLAAVLMCEATCHKADTAALGKSFPFSPLLEVYVAKFAILLF